MKRLIVSFAVLMLLMSSIFAQNSDDLKRCGSAKYLNYLRESNPVLKSVYDQNELRIREWLKVNSQTISNNKTVYTIPVVVHVLWHVSFQNIPDQRIHEQIAVLNEDFRNLNPDGANAPSAFQSVRGDCQIQFCLAQTDPQENPTNGITRTQTEKTSFDIYMDDAKQSASGGTDPWDATSYLNIWVVPKIMLNGEEGYLGYATFPGTPLSKDGVVITYAYFGKTGASFPYDQGRTTTHEVGHYLGLRHIWGDDHGSCSGTDYCDDTPNQADATYGCSSYPVFDACSSAQPGVMFMNFMDYSDDACLLMFTKDQASRIMATINGARKDLKTSPGCMPAGIPKHTIFSNIDIFPNPTHGIVNVNITMFVEDKLEMSVYNILGENIIERSRESGKELSLKLDLSNQPEGVYFIKLQTSNSVTLRKISLVK